MPRNGKVRYYFRHVITINKSKMKTLVIHPKDKTTDFLAEIYADKNWTVINSNITTNKLIEQIKAHDRIVMLGHGTEYGLVGYNNYVINSALVHLLVEKECVCIWCNANHFVFKHGLKGFNTGMIISEMEEAMAYDICCNQEQIEMSNVLFAEAVKKSVDTNNIITNILIL